MRIAWIGWSTWAIKTCDKVDLGPFYSFEAAAVMLRLLNPMEHPSHGRVAASAEKDPPPGGRVEV
jgi:hypothetical protein